MTKGPSYWGLEYAAQATSFKQAPGKVSLRFADTRAQFSAEMSWGLRETNKQTNADNQFDNKKDMML